MSSDPENHPDYMERAVSLQSVDELFPAVAGVRITAQDEGQPSRNRLVWMVDHAEPLWQLKFMYPLMDAFKELGQFVGFRGPEGVDDFMAAALVEGKSVTSADFSGWDARLPAVLIRAACDVVGYWFGASADEVLLMGDLVIGMGLVTPDGIYEGRQRGMPSGSGATIALNCVCHAILAEYMKEDVSNFSWYTVFGDDGAYSWDADSERLEDIVKGFGMKFNASKSMEGEGITHYLQNLHEVGWAGSRGRRSLNRTVLSMCTYENLRHSDWNGYSDTMRFIMQAEACRWHEQFEPFFRWVFQHDKFMQNNDLREVIQGAGGLEVITRQRGHHEFHRAQLEGLDSFATVQLWRKWR